MDANETKILFAFLTCVAILGVVLLFFIVTIIRYHRQNLRLYKDKIAVEIDMLERERSRVATDLHDHLGPALSTVKLQASVLKPTSAADMNVFEKLMKNLDGIVKSIRIISRDLRPPVLDRHGLVKALEVFIENIHATQTIHLLFECIGVAAGLSKTAELHIYRIVQEIIHNVMKHSTGKTVEIRLQYGDRLLHIEIAEDGGGFDFAKEVESGKGSGLKNIVNRVELLRGMIAVECGYERIIYKIDIPYDERENYRINCR